MNATPLPAATPVEDGYERYYTEKLWAWIPEIHRDLDAGPPANGALRALIEVVAAESATLRRDVDRLWDDQSIALCDDWAVAYLGALVGAVPVSDFNARGNRLSAARAVAYQRRGGTPALIQMLIRDMTGAEGVAVEGFRSLARLPHRLDIGTEAHGPVSGTPRHGLADLRAPRMVELHGTAFDEAAHFPDIRRLRGPLGRHGLGKVNLHLYPVLSVEELLVTPHQLAPGRATLDPSGRDVALFQRGQTSDRAPDAIRETDLPRPIACRRMNATTHLLTALALAAIDDPALDTALAPLLGWRFRSARDFRMVVERRMTPAQVASYRGALLDATTEPDAPKAVLLPASLALSEAPESGADPAALHRVQAADLSDWGAGPSLAPEVALAVDPGTGRMIDGPARGTDPVFAERLHVGRVAPIGAGGHPRIVPAGADAIVDPGPTGPDGGFTDPGPATGAILPATLGDHLRFTTSRSYAPALPPGRTYGVTEARLDASDGTRPFLRWRPEAGALDITFAAAPGDGPRCLDIDGLWIALLAAMPTEEVTGGPEIPPAPLRARLVLDGQFDRVMLRHVTLDPGGEMARLTPDSAVALPYTLLEIAGQVAELSLERCVTGPIHERLDDPETCNAGRIAIRDSVLAAIDPATPALRTERGHVRLERCTVLGDVAVARLDATDSLIDGRVTVTDPQNGCFRYSATGLQGGAAILPPRFEALTPEGALPHHWLASRRFGDAWFAALSGTAPDSLSRGASNGSAMGAFNARGWAVLRDDLAAQLRRYLPVGQIPQFITEREEERVR